MTVTVILRIDDGSIFSGKSGSVFIINLHLVCKRWSDVFLMSLIFAAIMVLLFAVITVQDWCDVLIEKIGAL